MAGGQPSLILQHLRNLLRRRESGNLTDGQLLERFVQERDEAAFEVLVWRHGPMVLALGQRVLHNPHDAEDVLQAAFLTLVRKAGSIGKGESLSSWLYKVAYRIALRARAAKTIADGRPFEDVPAAKEADEVAWRELRPLLDAAIQRLPEKYRAALVLCDLQGKTYREAAEQLGCAIGTVSTRVTRARQLLRKRLAHHGLSVSLVALSAALAHRTAAAMPAILTKATIRAAAQLVSESGTAGIISASVAELIEGTNKAMWMSRFKIVMLLALAAGAAAVGAGVIARREPPTPSGEAPREAAAKPPAEKLADAVTVRGRVLDPDGKPVKGARLYWPRVPKTATDDFESLAFPQRAQSDAEGRFRFEMPRSDIKQEWNLILVAAADGYGVSWSESSALNAGNAVTLRLVKDHPIQGRILSTERKPLAGVRVRAVSVSKLPHQGLEEFLAAWKRDWRMASQQISGPFLSPDEKSFVAVTDKEGRFRISGVGVERIIVLRVRGSGVAEEMLYVFNRAGFDAAPVNKTVFERNPTQPPRPGQPPRLYGPTVNLEAKVGRRIEGTVREAGSGKGVAGFRIYLRDGFGFRIQADSDEQGRYQIRGVPQMKRYRVFAKPPANSAWLSGVARVEDQEDLPAVQVDFTVARGILLSGRVLDRAMGKGVEGGIRFVPLPGNKFFDKPGYDSYKDERLARPTDIDGRFQLAVLPGPGVLMFQASGVSETANGGQKLNPYKLAEFDAKDHEHVKITEMNGTRYFFAAINNALESLENTNAVKVLDLAPDAGTAKCDLFVERGQTMAVKIEDADGKPLTGTTVAGVTALWPNTFTIKEATCTAFALDPKNPRHLFFFHAERKLAGSLTVRGDEKEPPVVRMGRAGSAIGRILDRDGQPIAGVGINLSLPDRTASELYRQVHQHQQPIRTGKDGRFRVEGIVPEVKFTFGIVQGRTYFVGEPPVGARQVKPGETLDLGDIRVKPAR